MRRRAWLAEGVQVRTLHRGKPGEASEIHDTARQALHTFQDASRFKPVKNFAHRRPREARGFLNCLDARTAKAAVAVLEAAEQAFQDVQAGEPQDAIAAAGGLGAAFKGLCFEHDASALIAIERPAVLARVRNEPSAAAKVISHGDFSPKLPLG